ncbi:MAG TPA: glutathione S-transferase family protein [Candidatus Binatia bacterium]|nr:glutathione S-transferase family protein [Candidatus Binatia bacterium]
MATLYATPLSANGRKVLAAGRHLGLAVDVRIVDVYRGEGRSPEYLALHPLGKIPALVDGDLVLWESNAILMYLSERHAGFRLWSRDPAERADIARWLFWEASEWQPALAQILAGFVGRLVVPQMAALPPVDVDWADARFRRVAGFLEGHLDGRQYVAGSGRDLTLADLSVAGMMTYARAAGFPSTAFPALAAWYARIEALEAWQATAAGPWRGPGAAA